MESNVKRIILFLICTAVFLGFTTAQETDKETATAARQFSLGLSAAPTFLYSFPVGEESWNTGYQGVMKLPRFQTDLGLGVEYGQLKTVSNWGIESSDKGTSIQNQENYLGWNPDFFRFGFGYQIYSWGVSDGRNPTDNLNPRDYTTLEGAKLHKLPVLSFSTTWYPNEVVSVDAAFVPQPSDSLFPVDYAESLHQALTFPVTYSSLDSKIDTFITGGKINIRSSAVDASISYLYDFDKYYTPVIADTFAITLERKRLHRFGIDAKTTIDRFGLWAEACYSLSGNQNESDYTERLSKLDYTVGIDFNYGINDCCYLNIQYTGSIVPDYDSSANTYLFSDKRYFEKALLYSVGGINEGILQGLTWSAQWNIANSFIVPSISGSYSFPFIYDDSVKKRFGSLVLKPSIDFMPFDSFHLTAGAILAYSLVQEDGQDITLDTTSGAGVYTPQNHLFLTVSYKWNFSLTK